MSHFIFHLCVAEQMHIGQDNLHKVVAPCAYALRGP